MLQAIQLLWCDGGMFFNNNDNGRELKCQFPVAFSSASINRSLLFQAVKVQGQLGDCLDIGGDTWGEHECQSQINSLVLKGFKIQQMSAKNILLM